MKYIRTKDGIFNIEKYGGIRTIVKIYDVDESLRLKYENTNEPQQVGDRFVIIESKDYKIIGNNTANTIEELCDELVVYNPNNDGYFYPKHFVYANKWETMLKPMSDHRKSKGIEIYGAIWTDKSLRFVARMNEKGELELL